MAEKPASLPVDDPAPVTMAGCLDWDRQTFWLKNASGADVQKVRSWKSGFLRKRSPAIALADPADASVLHTYVGRRVSASGTLIDGQLRTRSVQQIASSCN